MNARKMITLRYFSKLVHFPIGGRDSFVLNLKCSFSDFIFVNTVLFSSLRLYIF